MAASVFAALRTFLTHTRYVRVVLATKTTAPASPLLRQVQVAEDVANDFRQTLLAVLPHTDGPEEITPFDPGYKPEPHEWMVMPIADSETVKGTVGVLSATSHIEMFDGSDDIVEHLRYSAVVIGSPGHQQATFFRVMNPHKELSRRPGFALLFNKGVFNHIKQKIFLFDRDIDCVAWNDQLYIVRPGNFMKIFDYYEELRTTGAQTLNEIQRRIPIANVEKLEDLCARTPTMLLKLGSIARKPYLGTLTMADIRRTIAKYQLEVRIVNENGQDKLEFNGSPRHRWDILKLLDDSYLDSGMTQQHYEVNSKRRL